MNEQKKDGASEVNNERSKNFFKQDTLDVVSECLRILNLEASLKKEE